MSELEKFEAQGRAYANLKQARSNAATLTAKLQQASRDIGEAGKLLGQFANAPLTKGAYLSPLAYHLKGLIQAIDGTQLEAAKAAINELVAESERIAELQAQVDQF